MKILNKKQAKFIPTRFLSQICRNKNNTFLLLCLIAGGILLLSGGGNSRKASVDRNKTTVGTAVPNNLRFLEEGYEAKLQQILENISGAGRVRVKITLQSDNIKSWQNDVRTVERMNNGNSERTVEEKTILPNQRDNTKGGLLQTERAPQILGVIVTASGADDGNICTILTETAATLLNLPPHRVLVVPGIP